MPKETKKTEVSYIEDSFINIDKCFSGIVKTKDDRYLTAVEIEPINFKFKTGEEQENVIEYFKRWIKIAPLKFQFKSVAVKTDINKIIERSDRDFEQLPDKEAIRYIHNDETALIRRLGNREGVERHFYIIIEYLQTDNYIAKDEDDILYYLNSAKEKIRKFLYSCGNTVITHKNDDYFMLELCYKTLNKHKSIDDMYQKWDEIVDDANEFFDFDEEKIEKEKTPFSTIIAPDKIEIFDTYVVIDGVYHCFLYIPSDQYPLHIVPSWLSPLINVCEGVDVDIFASKMDTRRMKNNIRRSNGVNDVRLNHMNPNGENYHNIKDSVMSGNYILNMLSSGDSLYYINTLITISADTYDSMYNKYSVIKDMLDTINVQLFEFNYMQDKALNSFLPLNHVEKEIFEKSKRNITTEGLAAFYPFTSYEVSDNDGILMGVNNDNNSLCVLDLFNTDKYKNANLAILGRSGAGKTFTLSLMLKRFRMKGIQTSIIMPLKSNEFLRLAKAVNGEFIKLSSGSKDCINIMEIRRQDNESKKALGIYDDDEIILNKKVDNLLTFFSLIVTDITLQEKQLLDDAILKTYEKFGITKDNDSLIDHFKTVREPNGKLKKIEVYKKMPILGDLYEILRENPKCERIADILQRYVTGSASAFNGQTNVDLTNQFIVFDLSALTEELLPIGMFIALDYIWDKAKEDLTKKKVIAIDETWKLMKSSPLAAKFVVEIFKIIRGYGGAAIAVSQDIEDFFSANGGEYGKAIISNSQTKMVLGLESEQAQLVQKILNLSNKERKDIEMFERGQILLASNSNTFTIDFIASQFETKLVTTDRKKLAQIVKENQEKN